MGSLTTNKSFTHKAKDYAYFFNDNAEPTMHVEGIVEVAGDSDINVDNTSLSSSGTYIGKAADGDFSVAYASGTTLTLGDYPAGVSGFTADDIEFVRQIDTDGVVTATYSRDDSDITAWDITANVLTMTGASFQATDTFVIGTNILSGGGSASSGSSVGGGNNTYSNASGDFVATITDSTKNVTITGLPFTLEVIHVVAGSIKKIDTDDDVTTLPLTNVTVAGGVITLADADDFATGDVVMVTLIGPDKAYDVDIDNQLTSVQNPDYAHYTDVEHLIEEEDLAIVETADADADTDTIEDDSAAFSTETVAVGYTAYQTDDGESAVVNSVTDADTVETATLSGAETWLSSGYSLPEVKRFEISMESYKFLSIHYKLAANDLHSSCYLKVYGTNNEDADTTDDTDWVDLSIALLTGKDGFDTDQVVADGIGDAGAAGIEDIVFITSDTILLKYMIKIVAECDDGNADNDFNVYIKKGY